MERAVSEGPGFREAGLVGNLPTVTVTPLQMDPAIMPPEKPQRSGSRESDPSVSTATASESDSEGGFVHVIPRERLESIYNRVDHRIADVYRKAVENKTRSLIVVKGGQGTGKKPLVKETLEPYLGKSILITGTFDFLQHPVPFPAFNTAMAEFARIILDRGEKDEVRRDVRKDLGPDALKVLADKFPCLATILEGPADESETTEVDWIQHQSEQRFVFVFRRFLRAICTPARPLVIFLESLQWADACSMDLLYNIVSDEQRPENLSVIGTCDKVGCIFQGDPSTFTTMPVSKCEEKKKWDSIRIWPIELKFFDEVEIRDYLASLLGRTRDDCEDLAQIVFTETKGDLHHIVEFVDMLQRSELLTRNSDKGIWTWNTQEIHVSTTAKSCDARLREKVEQLCSDTQEVLKVASCFGSHVQANFVEYVLDRPVDINLKVACEAGVLMKDDIRGGYSFAHARFHKAAHDTIKSEERELFHAEIARRLWRKLDSTELDRHVFILLAQFIIGRGRVTRDKERISVATLCLHAAHKAVSSSAFRSAAAYLDLGLQLLGKSGWKLDYDLTLSLHNAGAEMMMLARNYDRMNEILDCVFENAYVYGDKIQAYFTKITVLGLSDCQEEAVNLGLEVLTCLGIKLPSRLCNAMLLKEFRYVMAKLRRMSDEEIMRLPRMTDQQKLACSRILQQIFVHSAMTRPQLCPFLVLKSVRLVLDSGLSETSSVTFCDFALLQIAVLGDVVRGERFGNLAMALLERFGAIEYVPRVYGLYYSSIMPWRAPLKECIGPLIKGNRIGFYTGDYEFSGVCAKKYCMAAAMSVVPLPLVVQEMGTMRDSMMGMGHVLGVGLMDPLMQAYNHLMGKTENPLSPKGDIVDYDLLIQDADERGMKPRKVGVYYCQLILAYVFGDCKMAAETKDKLTELIRHLGSPPSFVGIHTYLLIGLSCTMAAEKGINKRRNVHHAKRIARNFGCWADKSPQIFLDQQSLLDAEINSVKGKSKKAMKQYLTAIALSEQSGLLFFAAVSNERCGRHLLKVGRTREAERYLRTAHDTYERWGGMGKCRSLAKEFDYLVPF